MNNPQPGINTEKGEKKPWKNISNAKDFNRAEIAAGGIDIDLPTFCNYMPCCGYLLKKAMTHYYRNEKWWNKNSHLLAYSIIAVLSISVQLRFFIKFGLYKETEHQI